MHYAEEVLEKLPLPSRMHSSPPPKTERQTKKINIKPYRKVKKKTSIKLLLGQVDWDS